MTIKQESLYACIRDNYIAYLSERVCIMGNQWVMPKDGEPVDLQYMVSLRVDTTSV